MKEILMWLKNSTKIKRWILLTLFGLMLISYGFCKILILKQLNVTDLAKIVIAFVVGFTSTILGLIYMQRRTLEMAVEDNEKTNKIIASNTNNINDKGPNIVVIGGGTGLNNVLKGLKNYTNNLTAIVTVSTYGSRTHKPTQDLKSSLIALAQNTDEMQKLINYEFQSSKLRGMCFGDLYLEVAQNIFGDFTKSIEKSRDVLSMIGTALPVTLDEMKICAELDNGMVIEEKDKIAEIVGEKVTKINRVYINPSNCRVAPGVIEAIQKADAIIIGPGNLYTNVIPNLLIKNVAKTIRDSKALKLYISNIMTEPGLTDDYDLSDHIKAITEHAGQDIIDYCICDNGDIVPEFLRKYNKCGANLVSVDTQNLKGIKVVKADISCVDGGYIRHNPDSLAKEIIELICNELRFKDKQSDEQYLLLNSKLKEKKKKEKKNKIKRTNKKPRREKVGKRGKSKFSSKYRERIESIQNSDKTREENIKLYEQITTETKEGQEKEEKDKFLRETFKKK